MTEEDIKASVFTVRAFTSGLHAMSECVIEELDRRGTLQREAIKREMNKTSETTIEALMDQLGITWDDIARYRDEV